MRKGKDFLNIIADAMDMDNIPMPGTLLVEICDQRRVLIENHRGVVGYACHEVVIKVPFGFLHICGDGLYLNRMSSAQLIITGRIDAVSLRGKQ